MERGAWSCRKLPTVKTVLDNSKDNTSQITEQVFLIPNTVVTWRSGVSDFWLSSTLSSLQYIAGQSLESSKTVLARSEMLSNSLDEMLPGVVEQVLSPGHGYYSQLLVVTNHLDQDSVLVQV